MNRIIYSIGFTISLLFLAISCETNPPSLPDQNQFTGKIYISSDVDSAEIFLDDLFTDQYTPDTLETTLGEHKVSLSKEGYASQEMIVEVEEDIVKAVYIKLNENQSNKLVLLEDFANVSCDPCVISNSIIKELKSKYDNQLLVVKYSTNFPSPNDPFYLGNKSLNHSRMGYYNILFAPTLIVDGILRPVPTDSTDIIDKIESRFSLDTPFILEVSDSISGGEYHIRVSAELSSENIDISDLRLFSAIIEKEIIFDHPPGSNGETKFYDVMRAILPNQDGATILYINEPNEIEFTTEINSDWRVTNLTSITFIQNINNGEVVQAVSGNVE